MSSEEKPKPPRKPRAPKKTAKSVETPVEIPTNVSPNVDPLSETLVRNAVELVGTVEKDSTEIVSSASAPFPDNGIRQKPPVEGPNNLYFVHPADYHDDDDSVVNRIEPTEVVSQPSSQGIAPSSVSVSPESSTNTIVSSTSTYTSSSSFPPHTTDSTETDSRTQGTDSVAKIAQVIPQTTTDENGKNMGNDRLVPSSTGSIRDSELLESLKLSRVRIPGETKSACKERLRMLARNAGLPRGTGPGTAYEWAMNAVIELFAPPPIPPAPVSIEETKETAIPEPEILSPIGYKSPQVDDPIPVSAPVIEPDVPGLGTIPESWPKLPPNAPLQAEIAWVTANRLVVRSGKGVDLARALSPAPSYSALSWLETSILFPSKFADISVKATADQDTEKEFVRREKMAIEEIRSLLAEMLDAKTTQSK